MNEQELLNQYYEQANPTLDRFDFDKLECLYKVWEDDLALEESEAEEDDQEDWMLIF